MDGILNVYKEKGFTSHDVVAKLRGIVKQKKIGHTGTLDPDAEGVLPVCLGKATKLCDLLTDKDKCYEAVLKLGVTTDTQDLTGTVRSTTDVALSKEAIKEAVLSFQGSYDQVPPMYSAIKVNGKKLYELAREGIEIERKPRSVLIHKIDILEIDVSCYEVRMRVFCSKGTYIRTLCADIGDALRVGGAMKSLLRVKAGSFIIEESHTLKEIEAQMREGALSEWLVPVDAIFSGYESFTVHKEKDRLLNNGNSLSLLDGVLSGVVSEGSMVRVYDSFLVFKGLYQIAEQNECLVPYKMFL
ncbi:MAG: tRNA pseudouridine55 synthase [Clostridiales bacterium]|nr:tRNA pseudouridine55 synthase [Clostridiales bacterium]